MKLAVVVLGLVHRRGRWFLQRRDPGNPVLPGVWEFPGGKAGRDEPLQDALRRELMEELRWEPSAMAALEGRGLEHRYPDRIVRLHPFVCEGGAGFRTNLSWGWFTAGEMRSLPIPEANLPLVALLEHLR